MANEIKLKRGSGSDPGSSDLVVGEIAIRTDTGKLFTKKDNGSVAEISGSGGIDDGDKGDITVSNGGDTFTIDNGVVTSAKIADGTIVNADINASAAIDGSKIQTAGIVNAGVMTAAQHNKLAGIESNATADMTGSEILSTISGEDIILGEISSTGNSTFAGNVTISSSDGGSSAAPEIDLYRISASPADADYLGQIKFSGESDDDSKEVYAKITGKIGDASSGTEDGIIEIAHTKAGSNNISARFTSTDLKLINGTGLEVAGETDLSELTTITKTTSSQTESILKVLHSNLSQGIGFGFNTISAIGSNTNVDLRLESKGSGEIYLIDNVNAQAGVDVTGNITVSGTVDGRDLATDGTKLDGIASGATNVTNTNQLTNGAGFITATLTNEQVQDIVGGMLSGNTETGITVTYQDGDGTIDFVVGTLNQDTTGNAATATALETARTIAGVSFDGTSNISLNNNAITNGAGYLTSVGTSNISDDAVTFAKLENVENNRILGRVSSGSGNAEELTQAQVRTLLNVENGATADQTASEIKTAYESNSDTNAFTDALLSKLNGIAASATNVTNNNQLTNGAGYITATLTNEQVQDIVGGMVSGNTETGITVTYQDGDGTLDFVVGTLNQDTTGNAATATALETARTIGGVSFNGTANINLPGVNTAGNQNTSGTSGGFTAGNASNLNSGTIPDARFPSTLPAVDGSNLTGISAGATGGGSDEVFYENDQTVTTNYTITNGKNAMAAGPITVNSGVTVTVGSGETLTIV